MKTTKKVILSACLAAIFACVAVVCGVMFGLRSNNSANPSASSLGALELNDPTTPAKMKMSSETSGLAPGSTFTISVTISVPAGTVWYGAQSVVAPVSEDGTSVDYEIAQYLSLVSTKLPAQIAMENGDFTMPFMYYSPAVIDKFDNYNSTNDSDKYMTGLLIMMNAGTTGHMNTSVNFTIEVTLKLADDTPIDNYETITFGMSPAYASNRLGTIPSATQANVVTYYAPSETTNQYASNLLQFNLRDANSEAEIDSIRMVVDTRDSDGSPSTKEYLIESTDFVNGNYNITLPDTDDLDMLIFYPKMKDGSENATVKAGATASASVVPATLTELTESGVDITVSGTNRIIYIQSTPEDGNTDNVEIYTLTLTFTYARLSNLSATSTGTFDSSVTNKDLELGDSGVFDPYTLDYTAYVPEGTTSTAVKPTIATDYGISSTVTVIKDGNYTILGGSGSSMGASDTLYLQNITDGEKISFKLTAQDGTTTQTYNITFEIVTTDTSLKDVVVTGNTSGARIPNNEDKATEEGVDYYFSVGEDPAEAKIEIVTNDPDAKIQIAKKNDDGTVGTFVDLDSDTAFGLGEYVVKVIASAGNEDEFTLILAQFDGFKLADDAIFSLIALEEVIVSTDQGERSTYYRRTYEELGWTHGIDDLMVERFVLGEIEASTSPDDTKTTLSDLVDNFSSDQLSKICVYSVNGDLIYDGANGGIVSGHASDRVCTGWKIVYGTGSTADEIYVSVLGDTNGDGLIQVFDGSDINAYIAGLGITFSDLEVKLAAFVLNNGEISVFDTATLNAIIAGNMNVEIKDYFRP